MRAGLDIPRGETAENRSDIEVLFSGLPEPTDLEIDGGGWMLYWCDRGELPLGNTVNCASVARGAERGGGETEMEKMLGYKIVVGGLHEAIGLQLDVKNGFIYASDLGGGCIASTSTGRENSGFTRQNARLLGLHWFSLVLSSLVLLVVL